MSANEDSVYSSESAFADSISVRKTSTAQSKLRSIPYLATKRIFDIFVGILGCVLLVPVIYAFGTTASNSNYFPKVWSEYFSIIDVISRHMIFTKVEMGLDHWPNIYCGIAIIPFVVLYFMSKKIRTKE